MTKLKFKDEILIISHVSAYLAENFRNEKTFRTTDVRIGYPGVIRQ